MLMVKETGKEANPDWLNTVCVSITLDSSMYMFQFNLHKSVTATIPIFTLKGTRIPKTFPPAT